MPPECRSCLPWRCSLHGNLGPSRGGPFIRSALRGVVGADLRSHLFALGSVAQHGGERPWPDPFLGTRNLARFQTTAIDRAPQGATERGRSPRLSHCKKIACRLRNGRPSLSGTGDAPRRASCFRPTPRLHEEHAETTCLFFCRHCREIIQTRTKRQIFLGRLRLNTFPDNYAPRQRFDSVSGIKQPLWAPSEDMVGRDTMRGQPQSVEKSCMPHLKQWCSAQGRNMG